MISIEPILYFVLLVLVMWAMLLMVRLSDLVGEVHELKEKIRLRKGERPEEVPEWI